MLVREEVGGFERRRPEEDEQVHGAFEAAGSQAEGEDLFVDCFQRQYGAVLEPGSSIGPTSKKKFEGIFLFL